MSVSIPVLTAEDGSGPIPKILHQVWVGSSVPRWVQENWARWDAALPDDWTTMRHTEETRAQWPLSAMAEKAGLPHVVVLADLIRLEMVYRHGGVYVDSDTIPIGSIDSMAGNRPGWVGQSGWEPSETLNKKYCLNNALFGFPPRHPFPTEVWNRGIGKLDRKSAFYIAGPNQFEKVMDSPAGAGVDLPPRSFFPDLPREHAKPGEPVTQEFLRDLFPDAVAVHTANKSWYGANHSTYSTPTFIMGVPWIEARKTRAEDLADQTRGALVWDEKHDAMHTWRKTMAAIGDGPAIILEDDVTLTDDWRNKIEDVIADHREDVIQFFSMRGKDLTEGSRYEPGRTFLMNQCYYLPKGVAKQLHAFTQNWALDDPFNPTGYDIAMATWMKVRKMKYWLSVPSLVQHEPWISEINSKRPRNRQSGTFQ